MIVHDDPFAIDTLRRYTGMTTGGRLSRSHVRMDESQHSSIQRYQEECLQISRQIHGWANSLQNSNLEGQRNWNDAKQVRFEQQKRQDTFRAQHAERMKEIEARIRSQQPKHTGESAPTNRDQDE